MQKPILLLSLAAVTTGAAVWLALRSPAPGPETAGAPATKTRTASKMAATEKTAAPSSASDSPESAAGTTQSFPLPNPQKDQPAAPQVQHIKDVSPAELSRRVASIEKETNKEMRRLVGLLDLDEQQQDQIYASLAASSRHWVPGMSVAAGGGVFIPDTNSATTSDASDDIMSLLNADQQEAYIEDEMDRAAWWAEIIGQLDEEETIPALDGSTGGDAPVTGSDTLE